MPDQTSTIISRVWGMCNPLRDDGVSYGDYLEQLTYLIFLKMADEYSKPPYMRSKGILDECQRPDLSLPKDTKLEEKHKTLNYRCLFETSRFPAEKRLYEYV